MQKIFKNLIAVIGILLIITSSPVSAQAPISVIPPKVLTVKEKVQLEFSDAPVMVRIANAESKFITNAKNPNSSASGVFQILRGTWNGNDRDIACRLLGDFDVMKFNADANIACARILYRTSGTTPWNSSKTNWQ
jgi:hypothetical protein